MKENLFVKLADDTETSRPFADEDKDFLKSLEKMADEIDKEADHSS